VIRLGFLTCVNQELATGCRSQHNEKIICSFPFSPTHSSSKFRSKEKAGTN